MAKQLKRLGYSQSWLIRMWFLCIASLLAFTTLQDQLPAQAQLGSEVFLIKPYLQLGNNPKLDKTESMEVVWFSLKNDGQWKVEYSNNPTKEWETNKAIDTRRIGKLGGAEYYRHTANLSRLIPGAIFSYRVWKDEKMVFQAEGTARKRADQAVKFTVVGDIGAGSPGQKKVIDQMFRQHPDFLMIPGDIVYDRGLVSEYLARFFPIMNADQSSPDAGAPFMRSILTMAAIGNHDVALSTSWSGTDFTKFPDALGYYLLWSFPLNGPTKTINGINTTRIKGNADNQLSFVKAAKNRFPNMANYSFDYGNMHWIVLDGNPYMDWTEPKIRKWVEDDLAKADKATWKFACFHQPAFSIDEVHADEQRMRLLTDIFERTGVDVVFAGHAHCYQRTYPLTFKADISKGTTAQGYVNGDFKLDKTYDGKKNTSPNGIIYIVTGGGGAKLYGPAPQRSAYPFIEKYITSYSFTNCELEKNRLKLTQMGAEGQVLDQFTIVKKSAVQ